MASGNPQKAVAVMVPSCVALNWKSIPSWFIIPARIPNDSEVTNSARQLDQNNLVV
ncbi:hypothetical protein D3C85_984630 [compost metagenome]